MRHILNRVYLTTDKLTLHDRQALYSANIGWVLSADPIKLPASDDDIVFESIELPQSRNEYVVLATQIHDTVKAGQGVLVYTEHERSPSFLIAIAYLIDGAGMTLPNAYMRVALSIAMLDVDAAPLIAAYGLSYVQSRELHGNLVAESRVAVSPITKQLFISGIEALENPEKPRECGIDAVVRLDLGGHRDNLQWSSEFQLLDLPIEDGTIISSEVLRRGTAFIHHHTKAGDKVLVHCMMGKSRSVTFSLAYLMEYEGMSLADAYALIVKGRPIAQPHPALLMSLAHTYDLDVGDVWDYHFLDDLLTTVVIE